MTRPMKTLILSALLAFSLHAQTDNTFCWRNSFPRGAGTMPEFCEDGFSKELKDCYTTCRPGFSPYLPATLS